MAVNISSKPKIPAELSGELELEEEIDLGFKPISGTPVDDLPPFPLKNIEVNRDHLFWEWMDKLKPEHWDRVMMYLFREYPIIDRKRVNPEATNNIEKIIGKWHKTDKRFLETHGSGRYKVIVNDHKKTGLATGKGGTIGNARFEVNDPDHPPIFVVEELVVEHPSNRQIVSKLQAEGRLTIEGKVMNQNQGVANDNIALIGLLRELISRQGQPKDSSMDNVTSMFTKTHETAMNMLKDQVKSDDPDKTVKLIAAIKEMLPKPDTSGNSTLELIVKMQADMSKIMADGQKSREDLMLKMMEMMTNKGEDSFDKELDRMVKLKELIAGESGGRRGNIWETVIEAAGPIVTKGLGIIENIINVKNYQEGLKRQAATANGTPPSPAGPQVPQVPQVVEAPKEGEMPKPGSAQAEISMLIKNGAGAIIINHLQKGEPGDAFAELVDRMYGKITYDKIVAVGKEGILEAMKAVPEFWQNVVPDSIGKFVDEFIDYGKEEEGEALEEI